MQSNVPICLTSLIKVKNLRSKLYSSVSQKIQQGAFNIILKENEQRIGKKTKIIDTKINVNENENVPTHNNTTADTTETNAKQKLLTTDRIIRK